MAVGPCGVEFREAFSCFHYSEADPKGSDCIEKFSDMQKCMQSYPELFEERKPDKEEVPPENIDKSESEDSPPVPKEDVAAPPSEPKWDITKQQVEILGCGICELIFSALMKAPF